MKLKASRKLVIQYIKITINITLYREKSNNVVLINSTSNSPAFSVLYTTPTSVNKTCLSSTAAGSLESSDASIISQPVPTNLDVKCEPLAVHFDPWQSSHTGATTLIQLPSNPESIVTSVKTPLSSTSIIQATPSNSIEKI